jgi:hypothetical protein
VVPVPEAVKKPARPSPCDVAAALVAKAEALRAEGRLARAARALGDALSRCPEKAAEIGAQQQIIEGERAAPPGESPDEIRSRAEALSAKGDAAGARRERERWLAAREKAAGAAAVLDLPQALAEIDLAWSPDSALAGVLHGGVLSIRDGDLRAEKERYPVGAGAARIGWLHARRAVLALDPEASTLRLVDLDSHRVGPAVTAHQGKAESFEVSADDRLVAVWGGTGVSIFDLAEARSTAFLAGEPQAISMSPSGKKIVIASETKAAVYDLPGLTSPVTLAREGAIATARMPSDDRVIVGGAGTVETFDAAKGLPVGKPITNQECEPWLLGARSEKLVWTCYAYMEAESAPGKKRVTLATPSTEAHLYTSFDALAASPDGSRVWFSLWGQQGIVDTKSGKQVAAGGAPYGWIRVQFRPDNRRIAARNFTATELWTSDLGKDERTAIKNPNGETVSALVVPADGKLLFADMDAVPPQREGEVAKTRLALRPPGEDAPSIEVPESDNPISFSEDGTRALLHRDKSIDVIELPKGTPVASVPANLLESGVLAPRGDRCAIAGDQEMRIVELPGGKSLASWKQRALGTEVRFSPGGNRLLVATGDVTWLYEIGQKEPRVLSDEQAPAAFAGDGKVVVARQGAVALRDLATDEERSVPGPEKSETVAASPDGRFAVAISGDSARLVDFSSNSSVALPLEGLSGVTATFVSGGRVTVLFSAAEQKALLFQAPSGTKLGTLARLGPAAAYYRAATGNVELLGKAAKDAACVVAPAIEPFSVCEDRYAEAGLFARAIAGRGCTAEDAGDVCD